MRAARHTRIAFDAPAPRRAQLVIDHLHAGRALARECRPLDPGARDLEIRTHPDATHVACSMHAGRRVVDRVRFTLECGRHIEPTKRHFIVIGAMKAGTTTLFELLAQHPALCRTWARNPGARFAKEINYFSNHYRAEGTALHYDWRFPFDAGRHAWTLDVSPNYAKWPASRAVAERIASLAAETRLAYILREPIDRIESHLAHSLHVGRKAANLEHCIRTSRYAMHLDNFARHFPREHILLLDFEALRREPATIMTQVCDFLGIERMSPRTEVHNRRGVDFRLDAGQRTDLAEALRADVRRLVGVYGFAPAESWLPVADGAAVIDEAPARARSRAARL